MMTRRLRRIYSSHRNTLRRFDDAAAAGMPRDTLSSYVAGIALPLQQQPSNTAVPEITIEPRR
jgi:hypothetical protein